MNERLAKIFWHLTNNVNFSTHENSLNNNKRSVVRFEYVEEPRMSTFESTFEEPIIRERDRPASKGVKSVAALTQIV